MPYTLATCSFHVNYHHNAGLIKYSKQTHFTLPKDLNFQSYVTEGREDSRGWEGRCLIPGREEIFIFRKSPRQVLRPIQHSLPFQLAPGALSPDIRRQGRLIFTVQLKCDGTRRRTGGEVKGKLSNGVGRQYSHTTSEHGVYSITTAYAHTSAASSRLNWRPRRFKWTRPFRRKTKYGFCACAITFQMQSITHLHLVSKLTVRGDLPPLPIRLALRACVDSFSFPIQFLCQDKHSGGPPTMKSKYAAWPTYYCPLL